MSGWIKRGFLGDNAAVNYIRMGFSIRWESSRRGIYWHCTCICWSRAFPRWNNSTAPHTPSGALRRESPRAPRPFSAVARIFPPAFLLGTRRKIHQASGPYATGRISPLDNTGVFAFIIVKLLRIVKRFRPHSGQKDVKRFIELVDRAFPTGQYSSLSPSL